MLPEPELPSIPAENRIRYEVWGQKIDCGVYRDTHDWIAVDLAKSPKLKFLIDDCLESSRNLESEEEILKIIYLKISQLLPNRLSALRDIGPNRTVTLEEYLEVGCRVCLPSTLITAVTVEALTIQNKLAGELKIGQFDGDRYGHTWLEYRSAELPHQIIDIPAGFYGTSDEYKKEVLAAMIDEALY